MNESLLKQSETTVPRVSVVIPTYNCEHYIAETIESVLGQSFKNLEIIVVDDGSKDRTLEVVARYGSAIKLYTQENSRVCAARNRGLLEASGEFVCFMDHDDYWFPDKLEAQVKAMLDYPEMSVVYGGFILWKPDDDGVFPAAQTFNLLQFPDGIDEEYSGWIYHQFLIDCWMLTSTAMFRREIFNRCEPFDVKLPYSEDWDLWLRLSRNYRFLKLNRPNTLYRQHAKQGNRIVREIDYRTKLLTAAIEKWGLCSPDGRCQNAGIFYKTLSRYHTEFAIGHALAGNASVARRSLLKAWNVFRRNPKPLLMILALFLGWRPRW